jgi:ElaB/YqjD/DUF883 family membrane-anchored ribosome-binding protein
MEEQPEESAEGAAEEAGGGIAEEAVRTIDEVRKLLGSATSSDLPQRAAEVRAKLETALGALETVAEEQGAAVAEGLQHGRESLEREVASVEESIRKNPLEATLIAAGIGFVIGLLVRRGE